jgi:hypothetical protein
MPKCREALADALARLLYDKPLSALDEAERLKLNYLRTLHGQTTEEGCEDSKAETITLGSPGVTYH